MGASLLALAKSIYYSRLSLLKLCADLTWERSVDALSKATITQSSVREVNLIFIVQAKSSLRAWKS